MTDDNLTVERDGAGPHEAALFGLAAATGDWREGTFLEKRAPRFTGS